MDSLAKLSLQDNALASIDFSTCSWFVLLLLLRAYMQLTVIVFPSAAAYPRDPCSLYRLPHLSISLSWRCSGIIAQLRLLLGELTRRGKLEMLNLSYNRLEDVRGLAALKALIVLNLGACLFYYLPLPYPCGFGPVPPVAICIYTDDLYHRVFFCLPIFVDLPPMNIFARN